VELIESLIREHGGELADRLSQASDLDAGQAQRFVPEAARDVGAALGGGGLDLGSLLGGDLGSLLSKLDLGSLAGRTGLGESQASGALESLLPMLLEFVQKEGGGLEGLASALGGKDAAGLLGRAGKLFRS
jgi:hypothetical protein